MSARDKISPSPTSIEPKKSVRLAQKRKLREESGTTSNVSEDFVTSYHYSKSNTASRLKTASPNLFNTSSSSSTLPSPSKLENKKLKRSATESPETTTTTTISINNNNSNNTTIKSYSPVSSKSPRGSSPSVINLNRSLTPAPTPSSNLDKEDEDIEEEEKWLDAIESGNLEELEDVELRQMKNPKLMTARQRAMLGKKDKDIYGFSIDDEMTSLFDKKESLAVTQEMIQLKAEKTEKRRQLAHEKKEKDKKKTMDRLLKKQDSKAGRSYFKPKNNKKLTDYKITFISKPEGNIVSFPVSYPIPFENREPPPTPPKVVLCAVNGCQNRKRYSCSKTKVPLCSLECYKKNLESHKI